MMKMLLPILFTLLVSFTAGKPTVYQKPIVVDKALSLELPLKYIESPTLTKLLKETNENAVYAAVILTPKGNVPFLVSKYMYDSPISIVDAFEIAKKHTATHGGYQLLDATIYKLGEKTLYCKVSEMTFDSGKKVNNIMYYLMKGETSSTVYELKLSCAQEETEANKKRLEQIVQSVIFL